jgi:glycosyltransferase involved in cell wall biosynthesis
MKIWLITIGEPIPHLTNKLRLHRSGIIANYIANHTKHELIWWTSSFNHFTKQHEYETDEKVELSPNTSMYVLKGKGYSKNISISRIIDHQQIAKKFNILSERESVPDIIVSAFPTLGLCEEAIKYGEKHNVPVLIDYRDMWPEVFTEILPKKIRFAGKIALYTLFKKTSKVFAKANGLIGITEEFLGLGLSKIDRKRQVYDVVFPLGYLDNQYNLSDYNTAIDYWRNIGLTKDKYKKVVFFGTLGYQFDLETVINAAKSTECSNYQFIFCGTGDNSESLKKLSKDNNRIFFPGYISAAQIKALMSISDFGLCPYMPKDAFLNSIPGKAIEYFSSGLPILTTLADGILGKFVEKHNIGQNYFAGNPKSFVIALEKLEKLDYNVARQEIYQVYNSMFKAENVYASYVKHLEFVVGDYKVKRST